MGKRPTLGRQVSQVAEDQGPQTTMGQAPPTAGRQENTRRWPRGQGTQTQPQASPCRTPAVLRRRPALGTELRLRASGEGALTSSKGQASGPTWQSRLRLPRGSSRCGPGCAAWSPRRERPCRTPGRPGPTLRQALPLPGGLAERGRRDEHDPALGDVHGPQVLHHAPQVRHVLVQGDVLLGVLLCADQREVTG